MKIKKIIPAIIILLCCMLLFTVAVMQIYRKVQFGLARAQYAISNFHEKKQAFEDIAKTLSVFFEEEKANNSNIQWIAASPSGFDQWRLACVTYSDDDQSYKTYKEIYKEQSRQDKENYEIVAQSFNKFCHGFICIFVKSDRVVFETESNYSIIYMKNGKAPKYKLREDLEMDYFYVDKLSSKWYQVLPKYKYNTT